jgi:hypothetical protein
MNRKKFVSLFSTSLIGTALIKANPWNLFTSKNLVEKIDNVKIKVNPNAVSREKSGKTNG